MIDYDNPSATEEYVINEIEPLNLLTENKDVLVKEITNLIDAYAQINNIE